MKIALAQLAALLVLVSATALAAEDTPRQGPFASCREDAEKLCADVQPGQGRIADCLTKKEAQVSPVCKEAMAKARQMKKAPARPPEPAPPKG